MKNHLLTLAILAILIFTVVKMPLLVFFLGVLASLVYLYMYIFSALDLYK